MDREKITSLVKLLVSEILGGTVEALNDTTSFEMDLGADSIDVEDLQMELGEEFNIKDPPDTIKTVGELIEYVIAEIHS